jgi:nitroreductase
MTLLPLDPDQLLSTTRAVRKRLDFDRPVPAELIRECVAMALQAPSGSNVVTMQFIVVTDAEKRRAIGQIYSEVYAGYKQSPGYAGRQAMPDAATQAQQVRVAGSADFLGEHMGDAPVLVISANQGPSREAAVGGLTNVIPATWSFMLAARARGLGTSWTSMHLARERDVADVLGIPYDTVAQAVLTPLAYTKGTDFKPALRPDPEEVIHWETW